MQPSSNLLRVVRRQEGDSDTHLSPIFLLSISSLLRYFIGGFRRAPGGGGEREAKELLQEEEHREKQGLNLVNWHQLRGIGED